jgi:ribonuclease T1
MPHGQPNPRNAKNDQWIRVAVILVALGIALYSAWNRQPEHLPAEQPPSDVQVDAPPLKLPPIVVSDQEPRPNSEGSTTSRTVIPSQTIRDQDGKTVFRGDVDLGTTLARIHRNERLRFSHDGIVFQNRERRLPQKPAGYYHEFVHPTPGVGGPGPQRIITGREGEIYYTPDHYRTFERLKE